MNLENANGVALENIGTRNIILGKNGCGKSSLLKYIERKLQGDANYGLVRYIVPERGGSVKYQANIEQSMGNRDYIRADRDRNQSENFRQQSVIFYKLLELRTLREIDANRSLPHFSVVVDKINSLLDQVQIKSNGNAFDIVDRGTGNVVSPENISSGKSELISLAIEVLAFLSECRPANNILLIDEPDVHLHPDLQHRLAEFIVKNVPEKVTVLVATHSTALLSALSADGKARVAFMKPKDKKLSFVDVTKAYRDLLPVFGAHPLSNIFSEKPILLIEGEDDERVWQQAVRSSKGKVSAFPCPVNGLPKLNEYERDANDILSAVYENAFGYSVRDRDLDPEAIDDLGRVIRMRLACRAAENMMLSDDVLKCAGIDWVALEGIIGAWVNDEKNKGHKYYSEMKAFVDKGCNRRDSDLKEIRNILLGFISNKPWEVLVGQAIAELAKRGGEEVTLHSLQSYLGARVCEKLLKITPAA